MDFELENDLVIQCDACGTVHIIDKDSLGVETYSYERNMGAEVEYIFDGETSCSCCRRRLTYQIRGYEYPVGAFNYSDYESEGCHFVQPPELVVNYYDMDYDPFEESFVNDEVNRAYFNLQRAIDNPESLYDLSPREFEELVAAVFERNGYSVTLTPATRDGGCDVIATKNTDGIPIMLLIECKH